VIQISSSFLSGSGEIFLATSACLGSIRVVEEEVFVMVRRGREGGKEG
jgi:hypothetical protein